ncbi:MAG: hypothetical protein L6Q97_20795, partial [Thermoanaerobaculia bacterium]|nr:hypothetical protein [Thermoanaerobaculia bacterium]
PLRGCKPGAPESPGCNPGLFKFDRFAVYRIKNIYKPRIAVKAYNRQGLISGTSTFGAIDTLAYTYSTTVPDRL